MTSEHSVWSPGTYDRAPILVSPNTLALPDRHDRVLYSPDVEGRPVRRGRSFRRRPKAETEGCYSPMVLTPYPVDSPTQESPLSPPPLDPDSPCSD
ncbi:hypothetical protein NLI96_g5584 [Meripilus lineatus]|uniref:Uncharacterized protein n=1 Tax=Meripilus lineatus TaxID=2056292 RepID=A0AAD5V4U1_9APHY|nr:hypothetical protein NLI96_g5584 [Physisporinus lineatus]